MSGELLIPVIMCGGAGTRLWPVSRESMPKQFVPLIDERSTFQQVLGRIANTDLFDRPIVITHSDFRFIAAEQLRECEIEADIVLEPSRRDSAMAVAVAAELAGKRRPHACVLVLAADHVVRNAEASGKRLPGSGKSRRGGLDCNFRHHPTYPATSYGYIRPGAKLNGGAALAIDAFVEKPDAQNGRRLHCRALSLEQRQFSVSRRCDARRDRRASNLI